MSLSLCMIGIHISMVVLNSDKAQEASSQISTSPRLLVHGLVCEPYRSNRRQWVSGADVSVAASFKMLGFGKVVEGFP